MKSISPQLDNIHYKPKKVLERCVGRGCQNNGIHEVLLQYIKRPAPVCEQCINEFRHLGFIAQEYNTLEESGNQSD